MESSGRLDSHFTENLLTPGQKRLLNDTHWGRCFLLQYGKTATNAKGQVESDFNRNHYEVINLWQAHVIGASPPRRIYGLSAMSIPLSFLFSFDFMFFDLMLTLLAII